MKLLALTGQRERAFSRQDARGARRAKSNNFLSQRRGARGEGKTEKLLNGKAGSGEAGVRGGACGHATPSSRPQRSEEPGSRSTHCRRADPGSRPGKTEVRPSGRTSCPASRPHPFPPSSRPHILPRRPGRTLFPVVPAAPLAPSSRSHPFPRRPGRTLFPVVPAAPFSPSSRPQRSGAPGSRSTHCEEQIPGQGPGRLK